MRIKKTAIVAGYALARALHRVRAFRSDGAEAALAMTVALLYLADIRTGFVGKPREGGGPWERYTLRDLAQLAFGSQSEADVRRASRAIDVLHGWGWMYPTKQVRRHVTDSAGNDDGFRSEPAVRRLNFDRICKMVGTSWMLSRDRIEADRKNGTDTASLADARERRHEQQQSGRPAAPGRRERPAATGDPRAGPVQIAAILETLKR